jgi:hypothetical protein
MMIRSSDRPRRGALAFLAGAVPPDAPVQAPDYYVSGLTAGAVKG